MQIDAIEVFHVALPLRRTMELPSGPTHTLETVLVRLESGGVSGWGEASPGNAPLTGAEWAGGVFACVRDWLAPALAGRMVESGAALQDRLARFHGNRFAKAALDTAWWDLHARLAGKPLHEVLGARREAVEVGVGFDRMDSIDELFKAVGRAFDAGYARVELKIRPGWDIQMINLVRREFPVQTIHVDIEGGMRLDHMELLCRLDDFMLAMVEQPLPADDLVGHAMVQEAVRTPVCLDEAITTPDQADMALELHSAKYVNVKPGRVGGLTPAIAIHDACHHDCTPCWVGAMPQSAVGARIGLALAAKENFTYPADYIPLGEPLAEDLAEPAAAARTGDEGTLRVPLWSEPGIGIEPDRERLERFCRTRALL
jgi:O-succinylbenzoate synthase